MKRHYNSYNAMAPKWTSDRDVVLRQMWGKHSCSTIADRLGLTKNAVIGRASRLNLKRLQKPSIEKGSHRPEREAA